MDQFLEAIGDTWHGVKYPINNIITCVVGKNPLAKKTGLIGVWNDSALQKLCDLDYHKYNIKDYLLDIMKATSKLSQSPSELPTSSESLGRCVPRFSTFALPFQSSLLTQRYPLDDGKHTS
ncbi:hypothetical protein DPSP01_011587 [Paraphaeosphaeria sporulosa]